MKRSEIHFKTGLVYLVVLLSVVVEGGTNHEAGCHILNCE